MRLYPVVSSGTIRITHKPMQLGPYSLPAGQPVLIPFFAIHRSPRLWEDPDAFKPERWLAGEDAAAAAAAEVGTAGSGEAGAAGGQAAAGAVAAGVAPEADDDDYVDVAADINHVMKDQTPQLQQQGVKDSKQQLGLSDGDAQQQQQQQQTAAPAAAAAKAGGSGLEIKVCPATACPAQWLLLCRNALLQQPIPHTRAAVGPVCGLQEPSTVTAGGQHLQCRRCWFSALLCVNLSAMVQCATAMP
jgi:hypothetical protein